MKKYFLLIVCLFISSLYFNMIQYPNKIVFGGISGLSIIINKFFNIEPSIIIFIINIILLILGLFFLKLETIAGTIISSITYPLFIGITKNITFFNINNLLIVSIIIGILSGITTGIVYKLGFSNGGLSILSLLVSKYTNITISKVIFIVNFIIVLAGGVAIGFNMIIYATIILLINSVIISIILGEKTL